MTNQPNPSGAALRPAGRGQAVLPLMTETGVAKLCGVHVQTLRRWRRLGTGPPWLRRGRQVVYDRAAVRDWWNDRRRP